jgi:hypothetical protein
MISFFYDSWIIILKFLIPGIFLGMVYDMFRLFRIAGNDKTYSVINAIKNRYFSKIHFNKKTRRHISDAIFVFIEDVLFFLVVAVTEILATFHFNHGEIRIYCLLISAIGFFIYQKTIGRLVVFFSRKTLYLIRKIIYWIVCLILTPTFYILRFSKKLISFLFRKRHSDTIADR